MSTLVDSSPAGSPNTRASPSVGRAIPSNSLIVVVLPAPLRPRKPQIDPAGTARSSPRSASTAPQCLRSPAVSMISVSATIASCSRCGPPGELGLEQPPDLVVAQAPRAQLLDRRRHQRLAGAVVGRLPGPRAGGDERPGAMPQLDHALVLELAVRLGHGVGIDHELLR